MPAWNGTISVTGLCGNSEASATAAVEVARLVKPASASGTILRDSMRMRFLPTTAPAVRCRCSQGKAQRLTLRMHVSLDCMILPPEQKPGTHVKATQ